MSISQTVADFATLAIQAGGWMEMDRLYIENRILASIGLDSMDKVVVSKDLKSSLELLDTLVQQAEKNGIISNLNSEKEQLEAQLMDLFTPPPSVVNAFFAQYYEKSPKEATDYFYRLCENNHSIKTREIAKNDVFHVASEYGLLGMTNYFSKSETTVEKNETEKMGTQAKYPKCQLCLENEGYKGRKKYPAKTNHRVIRMNLDGESWGFYYTPYPSYPEQAIFLSEEHRPMAISKDTFQRLLKIVEILPHYFIGSNAGLLTVEEFAASHAHYQGGCYVSPIELAKIETFVELENYPLMNVGTVKWPMSVIRLQSPNKEDLVQASAEILEKWQNYSDETVSIKAFLEDGTSNHSLAPIARKKGHLFELDLVLLDNSMPVESLEDIFYRNPKQKEKIGLSEIMGLAILPFRLAEELKQVEQYLLKKEQAIASCHQEWANKLKEHHDFTKGNITEIIHQEIGNHFIKGLASAGVFKRDQQGQQAFQRFLQTL